MFFIYNQNNSGGSFVTNKNLCHRVCIEANNEKKAEEKAEELGIYFNGVDEGIDCPCCGDRWHIAEEEVFPIRYGDLVFETPEEYLQILSNEYGGWTTPDARVFYKDGTVKEINREV